MRGGEGVSRGETENDAIPFSFTLKKLSIKPGNWVCLLITFPKHGACSGSGLSERREGCELLAVVLSLSRGRAKRQ